MPASRNTPKSGLAILNKIAVGHTLFQRVEQAWDVLSPHGFVCAVLCPRTHHLSVAPVKKPVPPVRTERRTPYGELVEWKITSDNLADGVALLGERVSERGRTG